MAGIITTTMQCGYYNFQLTRGELRVRKAHFFKLPKILNNTDQPPSFYYITERDGLNASLLPFPLPIHQQSHLVQTPCFPVPAQPSWGENELKQREAGRREQFDTGSGRQNNVQRFAYHAFQVHKPCVFKRISSVCCL